MEGKPLLWAESATRNPTATGQRLRKLLGRKRELTGSKVGTKGCHETTSLAAVPQKMVLMAGEEDEEGEAPGEALLRSVHWWKSGRAGAMEKMGPPGAAIF
jgi:hypothetical protein